MRIYFTPRLLMLATDTVLVVDGRRVARKGGFGLTETARGHFFHQGRQVKAELQVHGDLTVFTRIPYRLRLNGVTVSQGRLQLERLVPALAVWLTTAGLLALLAFAIGP